VKVELILLGDDHHSDRK